MPMPASIRMSRFVAPGFVPTFAAISSADFGPSASKSGIPNRAAVAMDCVTHAPASICIKTWSAGGAAFSVCVSLIRENLLFRRLARRITNAGDFSGAKGHCLRIEYAGTNKATAATWAFDRDFESEVEA
jgi:hypothetical protein